VQVAERWWETFFSGMFNECWRLLRTDQNTTAEADFLERISPREHADILDVPCGAGRLSLELTRRGHHVTGVDLCDEFLDEAKAAGTARQLDVVWDKRDMRELPWRNAFDLAICFGTSFGFLDEAGDLSFATAVHRALRPGGLFVIDTFKLLEIALMMNKPRGWARLNDIMLTYEHQYDFETGLERTDYEFFRNGSHEQKTCQQRMYTYHELVGLLKQAGFATSTGYSSLDCRPVRLGLQRLLLVATKT
jgi:SAM-dependent methyltransferase